MGINRHKIRTSLLFLQDHEQQKTGKKPKQRATTLLTRSQTCHEGSLQALPSIQVELKIQFLGAFQLFDRESVKSIQAGLVICIQEHLPQLPCPQNQNLQSILLPPEGVSKRGGVVSHGVPHGAQSRNSFKASHNLLCATPR